MTLYTLQRNSIQCDIHYDFILVFRSAKSKELEESKLKNNEMSEKLMGKNRQYLKLQVPLIRAR